MAEPTVSPVIAGGVAGAISRTVVSPLERMKIIYQVQNHTRTEYKMSMIKVIAKIWKEENWKGYWRGNGINCMRIVPYSAIQFASYNGYAILWQAWCHSDSDYSNLSISDYQGPTIGAMASMTAVVCTYSLDLVRTRLSLQTTSFEGVKQIHHGKPLGIWVTLTNVYRSEGGIRALYRGVIPTVVAVAPYVVVNFWNYQNMRKHVVSEGGVDATAVWMLGSGAISGALAQILTYPVDVIRRRCQVISMPGMSLGCSSMRDVRRAIWRYEGIRGFYKGLLANVSKVPASMVSSWLAFELTRDLLMTM